MEKSQIAKDVLIDMIECSGLDLERLEIVLDSSVQSVEALQRTYGYISSLKISKYRFKQKETAILPWHPVNQLQHFTLTSNRLPKRQA